MVDFMMVSGQRVVDACVRRRLSLDNPGFCLNCGVEVEGVEPDACEYQCEACGEPTVFGCEELLMDMDLEAMLDLLP
jgi:predicted RNA-binding Zn-ribbon protein involved in translation (DUF1610 family)